jgi:hypothetical protein
VARGPQASKEGTLGKKVHRWGRAIWRNPAGRATFAAFGRRSAAVGSTVVQQAVIQILEPIFDPAFHPSSHGFRPNRGAHTAIPEAKGYLAANHQLLYAGTSS